MNNIKVKVSISFKLLVIFVTLVIMVLGISTFLVSKLVRRDEQTKAEENNHTINGRTAETIQATFVNLQNNAAGYFSTIYLLPEKNKKNNQETLFKDFCNRNNSVAFVYSKNTGIKYNSFFTGCHADCEKNTQKIIEENKAFFESREKSVEIINASKYYDAPVICIGFPMTVNGITERACTAFSPEALINLMSTGSFNETFLLTKEGNLLIHSDYSRMVQNVKYGDYEYIQKILSTGLANGQLLLPDENGKNCFFAYHKIVGDMYVITGVTEADVFESINHTINIIVLISLLILCVSILIILFFSKSMTRSLGKLVDATHAIEEGDYNVDLKPAGYDEVGVLTCSFKNMANGLAERARLEDTMKKFTNRAIAEQAARGKLSLGGINRVATIFFSDIRSFTAMSEKMLPAEIVEFLNQYMTRMVDCVNKSGGNVDKFIGDAVMAEWGVPFTSGSVENDAWNAVKTALMMRYSLIEFNKLRAREGKPPVRIGCGINTGPVTAGQIGSNERMEYTVIGDAVNFASRTESLNKPFATDILLTENTWLYVKDKILYEEMPSVHVKGKEKAVRMFAVINAVGLKGPQTIDELRNLLGVEAPDLGKVNTDEEEKKYKIEG